MPKRIQEEVASFLVDAMLETGFKKTQGKHHDFSVNDICSCLCIGLAIWMDHR